MRAIWKGSIAFGLVHIPVNLYPATESQSTVSSNLLHKKDHSRIRYQRISEATGKEVPAEESLLRVHRPTGAAAEALAG